MVTFDVRTAVVWSVCFMLGVAGCGGGSPTGSGGGGGNGGGGNGGGGGGGGRTATTQVSVRDDFFSPEDIVVSPRATVTWTWMENDFHDVTWVSAPLDNSLLQSSGTHEVAMPTATGVYDYYCTIHGSPTSGMRGSVLVQ